MAFGLLLLAGIFTTSVSAQTVNICDRTAQVEMAILAAIPIPPACVDVTATQLAAITELDLSNMSITALQSDDFANLTGLTTLRLQGNTFTTPLPANLFDDLPSAVVIEIDLSPVGELADIALTIGGTTTINIANAFISKDATGTDRDLSFGTTLSGTSATATVNEGVLTITASNTITGDTDVSITANDGTNDVIRTISVMVMDICSRTAQVQARILARIPAISDCMDVTATHLAAITGTLNLSRRGITTLQSGDFAGLTSLTTLNLFDNNLTTIEANTFSGLTSLTQLFLSSNALTTIEANAFSGLMSLTYLDLSSNALTTIEADTFSGLTSLNDLRLSGNALTTLEAGAFSGLMSLTTLDLSYNDLTTIEANAFSGLTSLTRLDLESNDLTTIEANAFSALTSLTSLALDDNDLTTIEANAFSGLMSLTTLDLFENELTTIEANAFSGLMSLTYLDLSSNALTTIEADTFSGLTSLNDLRLSGNALTTLEVGAFSGLTSLDTLNLFAHALTIIEADTFSGLTSLTTLFLNQNDLTTIEAGAFSGLMSLTTLSLSDNNLTTIEANTFSGLTSLTGLGLNDNNLTTIEANTFSGLTSLTGLGLRNNNLTTIEANTFSALTSLTSLGLGGNALTTIEANTFSALTSLTRLGLNDNNLTTIEANTFSALTSLTELDLNNNALTTLPPGVFSNLANISTLDLSYNDLTTIEANAFSGLTSLTTLDLSYNDLTTIEANAFSGLTSLTTLDLSYNDLTTIEANAFSDLMSLTQLDLRYNDLTTIVANTFSGLTSLTQLDLNDNDLTTIEANTFSGLASLTELYLYDNNLTTIEANAFSALTSLTILDLSSNALTTPLPADIFDPLPDGALIAIDLSPIGDLPDVALTVSGTTTINVRNAFISRAIFVSRAIFGIVRTLSYTLTPANTAIATATEDAGVLTITGTGMGTTTVSVTADDNNPYGRSMFTRDIAVTVAEMGILAFDEATGNTLATPVAAENNGTDTFYVQLVSQPVSDVVIAVTSSDTDEGTVIPSELTFTASDWNTRQAVTITAVPDQIDRDDTFTVDFAITSGDGGDYPDTLTLSSVQVTITDDDTAGIAVFDMATDGNPLTAITTAEATTTTDTFHVALTSQPTGTVTVTVTSGDLSEGQVTTGASLTFTTMNWETRQALTVTAVDDNDVDGDETYDVIFTATGGGYDGVTAETVSVTNTDDDTASLSIADMTVNEDAGIATLTVTLSAPVTAGDVTVDGTTADGTATIAGGDYTLLTSETLTFTAGTISQTLDIIINDDTIDEVDETFTVMLDNLMPPTGVTTVSIADSTAQVTITDDDTLSDTINLSVSPLTVAETADTTTITVTATIDGTAVSTMPTTVTVSVGSGTDTATEGTDYATVNDFTLTIPALSSSGMATFTITPTDDGAGDSGETVEISGMATGFTTVNSADLTIVEAGILVFDVDGTGGTPISTATIAEASTDMLYVQLSSQPATGSNITISVTGSDANEGTVTPATLTFTDTNWETRQALTVTAVPDNVDRDGDSFMVNLAVTTGDSANYTTSLTLSVTVTVTDDDTASDTINLSISPDSIIETADETTITVTATLNGAASATDTMVEVIIIDDGGGGAASPNTDYTLAIISGTITLPTPDLTTITIPELMTSGIGTFAITPVADDVSDNGETLTISGTSSLTVNPTTLTIVEAGISVHDAMTAGNPISTTTIVEASGSDMLYVQLASQPAANVVIGVTSDDTNEGMVSPNTLTFTTMNWNTRQPITVTAVPDNVDRDGDSFMADFMVTTGDGGNYTSSLTLPSVAVTVTDDDTVGIDGYDMATGGDEVDVTTSEAGDMGTAYVELASEPTGTVTVTISGLDTTEHTLTAPTSGTLTFDSTNWNTPRQLVTLTGVDDNDVDGDQTYDITLTATGGGYTGVMAETVSITNTDDDTATISIADTAVNENAGTATVTVTLTPAVTAGTVTVELTTADGTATIAGRDYTAITSETLTFTAGSTSETLDITINDDNIAEIDETFTVMLDNLLQPTGVTTVSIADSTAQVTITDDDTAGIDAYDMATGGSEISAITTSEGGDTATFYIELASEPTADVTLTASGIDAGEHTLTTSTTLTFTTTNWFTRQAVTFEGVDDNVVDGDQTYTLTLTASGGGYDGVVETGLVTNTDDDTATLSIADMSVNENAGTATVTVTLTPAVTAGPVTVDVTTADGTATIATADTDYTAITSQTLTFTAGSTTQTLAITINDDSIDESDETFTVMLDNLMLPTGLATSDVSITDATAQVTITDDDTISDTIGLTISPLNVAETADATTITVTATLDGTAVSSTETTVTVSVGSGTDTATEGTDYATVADFDLTILAGMPSGMATFMIDPTEDTTDDNNEVVTISGTATGFTTVNPATLTIVEAGISVFDAMTLGNPISTATIAEASGSDMLYVQLVSQPAGNVTLSVTSDDTNEGMVSPNTLTFSTTNWNTRQLITVTAVPDNVDRDGDSFMVDFAVVSGDGGNYTSALGLPSVAVTVSDDDAASDTINLSISPLTVAETAGETTITVTATLSGATSTISTNVTIIVGNIDDTADEGSDYMEIPDFILTIPALETSSSETFTITPIADNENDNEETITISGTAGGFNTVNTATLTITGFSEEEQQVIEQTVAAQASSVTQVVSENIGSFLASRTSAPPSAPSAPAPPAPDGGGGGDVNRENFTSIDWQDWQHRFAKLAYEGLKRLDSDADMSLDWALKAAGSDGRLLMPLGVESLTLWAAGGRLKTKGDGMGEYDGGVNSFVVGVDTNLINNWLLGIAASYSDSQVDYTMDGAPIGSNEQNLYSVHPFLSHSLPEHGLTLWVTGGYGVGDIDFSHTTNDEATSDVTQWMAAGGIEKHIITNTLWQGALRLKGLWGNAVVDATEYGNGVDIRKVESTFWRARMESEMGYNFQLPGANVRPYALIGGRWDHNDAIVSGDEWHLDVGGGVEVFSGNAFALNISVHTQLTDGDTEEDSIIGTGSLTYDIGQDRQGLQITLSRPLNNTSPAWDQHSFNEVTNTASGINSAPLTSELAYGWTVRPFGLKGALQTYVQNSFGSHDRHYAVGLELAVNALTLNFESGYGEADNTGLESMLKTKIRW